MSDMERQCHRINGLARIIDLLAKRRAEREPQQMNGGEESATCIAAKLVLMEAEILVQLACNPQPVGIQETLVK